MRMSLKLAVRLFVLALALGVGLWPSAARAASPCQNLCCNPSCTGYYLCHEEAGSCVCTPYCVLL
jgi:hypothetical protein